MLKVITETIKKMCNMFKGYNKDTRTSSMTNMFIHAKLFIFFLKQDQMKHFLIINLRSMAIICIEGTEGNMVESFFISMKIFLIKV